MEKIQYDLFKNETSKRFPIYCTICENKIYQCKGRYFIRLTFRHDTNKTIGYPMIFCKKCFKQHIRKVTEKLNEMEE
jgi:hypothetical protein